MLRIIGAVLFVHAFSGICFAMHPLVTDDTGTQGTGRFEFEWSYEFYHDDTYGIRQNLHQLNHVLSYGVIDTVDLIVSLPYQIVNTTENGVHTRNDGISDMTLEVKWRFFEKDGLSFAVKPGMSLPTGDDEEGLGSGKVHGSFYFIATKEMEPLTFHLNAGYGRNETTLQEENDIYYFSFATEFQVNKRLKLVGNIGVERNTDVESDTPLVFILGGVVVPVTEYLDLDVGIKGGLTKPENDYGVLSGLTFRF